MTQFVQPIAAIRGGETALIDQLGSVTWCAFNERCNRLVHAFRALGLGSGDTIAIFAGNCSEYFEAMMAATHCGLTYVPVNWHFSAEELAYVIANSGAKLLLTEDQFLDTAENAVKRNETPELAHLVAVRGNHRVQRFEDYETLLDGQSKDEPADQSLGGPMFYTSGTTGRPKGVKGSTFAAGGSLQMMEMIGAGMSQMLNISNTGTTYLCGPVYHSAQWAFSFLPLLAGSRILMRNRFDAAESLQLIDEFKVTNSHLVPTQFHRLLRLEDNVKRSFSGASLEVIWHGAAPCPPEVKRRMIDWWGPVISEYYGSTEGAIVTTVDSPAWLAHPGTVGKATATAEITIRDDAGNMLATGETGQIYVKSLTGADFEYHNEPEKTASVHLEPGTYTFGDIGYLDEDGYLYLSDRKIDMIISGGVNIYPAEIEAVLLTHPAIEDAAVFGIPNDEFGEEIKAAVTVTADVSADDDLSQSIMNHCRRHLAGYKTPRSIDYEESLPRQETGKLYKRLLRDRYWKEAGRSI